MSDASLASVKANPATAPGESSGVTLLQTLAQHVLAFDKRQLTRGAIAQARTCSPRGSRSCLTIRSMRSRRGRRCTRWCATPRAIFCSTISASTKTLKSIFVPTAPIFPTPCERTSRTRWGCPSASRNARAAAAVGHLPARNGSACGTPKRPSLRRHLRSQGPFHRP